MDIKHFFEKLKSVFTSDKKLAVLCAVGVLGVVLLIISEFIPSGEKKTEKKESVTAAQSQETYAEDIEKRLTEIVSSIDGAGKTRVMVTLESGAEQVYAKNEKIKSDTSGGTALEKENFSDEKEYVLIETDGNEGGMIIKLIQPKIRGVAVVCENGGYRLGNLLAHGIRAAALADDPGDNRRSRYQRVARIYHENVGVTAPFK